MRSTSARMPRAASRHMTAGPASSSLAPPGSAAAKSCLMAAVTASCTPRSAPLPAAIAIRTARGGSRPATNEAPSRAASPPAAPSRASQAEGAYRVRQAIAGGQRSGRGTQVAQQLLQGAAQRPGLEQPGLDDRRQQVAMREEPDSSPWLKAASPPATRLNRASEARLFCMATLIRASSASGAPSRAMNSRFAAEP